MGLFHNRGWGKKYKGNVLREKKNCTVSLSQQYTLSLSTWISLSLFLSSQWPPGTLRDDLLIKFHGHHWQYLASLLARTANVKHLMARVLKTMQPQALVAWSYSVVMDGITPSFPEKICRCVLDFSVHHSASNTVWGLILYVTSVMPKEQTALILGLLWNVARRRRLQVLIAGIKGLWFKSQMSAAVMIHVSWNGLCIHYLLDTCWSGWCSLSYISQTTCISK